MFDILLIAFIFMVAFALAALPKQIKDYIKIRKKGGK